MVGVPRVSFWGCSHVFFDFWTMIEDVLCVFLLLSTICFEIHDSSETGGFNLGMGFPENSYIQYGCSKQDGFRF
jgi:hypothetical protein